jgi:hypothetical protein
MPRVRKKVLFPDMLDPVTKSMVPNVSRARSFATRFVSGISGWAMSLADSLACAPLRRGSAVSGSGQRYEGWSAANVASAEAASTSASRSSQVGRWAATLA